MRQALQRIVDHDRKVIAGRRLLAADDDVPPGGGLGGDVAALPGGSRAGLAPAQRPGPFRRLLHVEADGVRIAALDPRLPARLLHLPPRARIKRNTVRIARPAFADVAIAHHTRDLGPALEAREGQALRCQFSERRTVVIEVLGLPPHRQFPFDSEPRQVLDDRSLELRAATRRVDVLHAQQQPAAGRPRHVEVPQRRQRMAEMQMAVRARREAEYGLRHGGGFATKPKA
jgi:hypothetical protein